MRRGALADSTPLVVKMVRGGAEAKVGEDIELMQAISEYLDEDDPQLARLPR